MAKTLNITREDLRYLINESIRKVLLIREAMKEGGAAGHMTHPYEIDEFTFGNYKELVGDLFDAKIERYTEKLDGMNIFATVSSDGSVRFARKTADLKNKEGGMDPQGMAERWGSEGKDPTILAAYTNAYNLFGDVKNKLKDPVGFFNGNGYRIYANCEVIDQTHPNLIPYPKTALSFHGLAAFTNDGTAKEVDLPDEILDEKMAVLERLMPDVQSQYGQAQITPEVVVRVKDECKNKINDFIAQIDHIEEMAEVDDNTTIIQYREKLLVPWLQDHGYGILLDNEFTNYLIRRWVYGEKTNPNLSKLKKLIETSGIPNWREVIEAIISFEGEYKSKDPVKQAMKEIMHPVETFFYRLGNEVISWCTDYTNVGREEKTVDTMLQALENTKQLIVQTGDLQAAEDMTYWLQRFAETGSKYNSMEGVVFKYRGYTFKLTGSFAALNRAVNLRIDIGRRQSTPPETLRAM